MIKHSSHYHWKFIYTRGKLTEWWLDVHQCCVNRRALVLSWIIVDNVRRTTINPYNKIPTGSNNWWSTESGTEANVENHWPKKNISVWLGNKSIARTASWTDLVFSRTLVEIPTNLSSGNFLRLHHEALILSLGDNKVAPFSSFSLLVLTNFSKDPR